MTSAEGGRVPELDALRGLAAAAVVVYHSGTGRLPCGWAAVDFFFVLSGYLITTILLRHGGEPGFLARFYVRRGLRTWPAYYLTIVALLAFNPVLPRRCDLSSLPYELTYTQNVPYYWSPQAPHLSPYLGHTWTLAIEEQFYLVWPALALAVGRRGLGLLAVATAAGSVLARSRGVPIGLLGGRGDGLALGGLLAWLLDGGSNAGAVPARLRAAFGAVATASAAGLVALSATSGVGVTDAPLPRPGLTILAFNALWFGVVGLTVCYRSRPALGWLRTRPLRKLGEISYGLYLYHFVILTLAGDVAQRLGLRGKPFWREGPTLAACVLLAHWSWVGIERPILRLKGRFAYGPRPSTPGATPGASIGWPAGSRIGPVEGTCRPRE